MWELAVPVAIGVIVVLVIGLLLAKLYRRSTRDEAYVRTGLELESVSLTRLDQSEIGRASCRERVFRAV